jgi:hypothetical protein
MCVKHTHINKGGAKLEILIFLEGVCLKIQSYWPVQDFLLPAHEYVFLPGKSQIVRPGTLTPILVEK